MADDGPKPEVVIRLLLLRIATEHRLPFDVEVPNATTRKELEQLESGKAKKATSVRKLLVDLNALD